MAAWPSGGGGCTETEQTLLGSRVWGGEAACQGAQPCSHTGQGSQNSWLGWTERCRRWSGRAASHALCPQVFTLPKVSAKLKLKLTALEGSRVRRVSVAHFSSCRAEDYGEHHLAVLTNLGDVQVVSLPLLKPQVRYSCIRREDVSGIASCVFTKYGQGGHGAGAAGPLRVGPLWGSCRTARGC